MTDALMATARPTVDDPRAAAATRTYPMDKETRPTMWCIPGCVFPEVVIEVFEPVLRARGVEEIEVRLAMHAQHLLARRPRRLVVNEKRVETGRDQAVADRGEPCRTLGMLRAHLVQQERRMADEGGAQGLVSGKSRARRRAMHAAGRRVEFTSRPEEMTNRGRKAKVAPVAESHCPP
jgi:hypothetical protein